MNDTITAKVDIRIYSLKCNVCNKNLQYDQKIDDENDLFMTIEPCATCMEDVVEEYKESQKDE